MLDFLRISTRSTKRGVIEIYPKFIIGRVSDLMIRGGDFYAIWVEENNLWSTDEQDAIDLIDKELDRFAEDNKEKFDGDVKVLHMWDSENRLIQRWHQYCQKDCRDSFHSLDEKIIFSNTDLSKKDYASKKLSYPLEKGDITNYNKMMSVLYSPEERRKIEWAIGSIISGDSKKIQKFLVLYGASGTGKSTILNIIQQLFDGYYSTFDAKALGSSSNSFALEAFKSNPLVAIQHDGDLSRIEDNTRLNSLVSHELMTVNEKFKSQYTNRFKSFLFMGTNKPVRITDAKSGLIRRLIDVSPTGDKIPPKEFKTLYKNVSFELGAIAYHCLEVYKSDPGFYDDYIPISMMGASNDFYNFIFDSYFTFERDDGVSLKSAWELYLTYCEEAKVPYPLQKRIFKEELKNYFKQFDERYVMEDGTRVRSYFSGFKKDIFDNKKDKKQKEGALYSIEFKKQESILDKLFSNCPAQYANERGTPSHRWANVTTTLADLDTSKLHYVITPETHIFIDFDQKDADGNKSLELNLEAASKWPPTYAELSKSGVGIHLHYIYLGDVSKVANEFAKDIEIKTCSGNAALRRKLTLCNNLPIATLTSGLPLKGENKKVIDFEGIKNEKHLRNLIKKGLSKSVHPGTKPSIDYIYKVLNDAYESGIKYDVTDMEEAIWDFASNSTHQAKYCLDLVNEMKFKSENYPDENFMNQPLEEDKPIAFYDVEVFPNLFVVCWKVLGEDKIFQEINPHKEAIEFILGNFRLVGFNCRRYDNHIMYARLMGYNNEQLYNLSQKIISGDKNCFFGEAYNISYTDIYDFSSKKQSLKKFEIELHIHHQELGIPWNQDVPENLWKKVASYCENDVLATEAVWNARAGDFTARQIGADLAGMTVNDTTNSLTTKFIFGKDRQPQSQFNYRDLGDIDNTCYIPENLKDLGCDETWTYFNKQGQPVFPDYIFDKGKSIYRGEEVGEGGYVYAEPGIYGNVALLDVASMHPSSIIAENLFGKYTIIFKELVQARLAIKHEDWEEAEKLLGGKLKPYIAKVKNGDITSKDLANALKIMINSVYGLTAATFNNPFRDNRNKDNIVAKRGALFMINLKYEVQKRGFTVAHIKTDSIKIPDATPEIISFVMEYGKAYGYNFEHEDTYDRMCLVNDAVYIAKEQDGSWTATGAQFAVPYVFKTLFSKEDIDFEDMCETKAVSGTGTLYLDMNEKLPDVFVYEKEYDKLLKSTKNMKESEIKEVSSELEKLSNKISKGHNYIFVGRVGQFCPIKDGANGGILYREKDGKYYSVTGTKGWRWLESEVVRNLNKEDCIDEDYYKQLVMEAINKINETANNPSFMNYFGLDFKWLVSDEPYIGPKIKNGKPIYPS